MSPLLPNKSTLSNAGGPRPLPVPGRQATRIAQFRLGPRMGVSLRSMTIGAPMNNMHSFFTLFCPSPIPRRSAIMLVTLAWSGLAFCGEIHDAAKAGDLAKVRALLTENPALVSSKDTNGCTALILAAGWGHKDVAALLLANKAEVNAKEATDGWTPLHAAAANGQKDVVKLLLASKAEVNAKTGGGYTPLHWAALRSQKDVVKLLLANKAEVDLFAAAAVGDLEKLKALLKANPDLVSSKDDYQRTPLHWAAMTGYKAVVAWLLAKGANVNAADNWGETPLHYAAGKNHKAVVKLLLANKADVNAKSTNGATPLHDASFKGYQDVVELLRLHSGHSED